MGRPAGSLLLPSSGPEKSGYNQPPPPFFIINVKETLSNNLASFQIDLEKNSKYKIFHCFLSSQSTLLVTNIVSTYRSIYSLLYACTSTWETRGRERGREEEKWEWREGDGRGERGGGWYIFIIHIFCKHYHTLGYRDEEHAKLA